jgi:Leucine-rich repeat (LRR) protein
MNTYIYRSDRNLTPLKALKNLQILNLTGNKINKFESFAILNSNKKLKKIVLKGNPCCLQPGYPYRIFEILNQLEHIDDIEKKSYDFLNTNESADLVRTSIIPIQSVQTESMAYDKKIEILELQLAAMENAFSMQAYI